MNESYICNQCYKQMHRQMNYLEGKGANAMGYFCSKGKCDRTLRDRLDAYMYNRNLEAMHKREDGERK